ncbi:trypsin-like peptidase domain-containing protein [Comamonas sp. MYb21]|uniref:trypsin-like serine peptidase n=1 Tax=Comamonas sp. MYb21 TaxID=1848648 RepID=UPI0030A65146
MRYPKHAVLGLLWTSGMVVAQPTTYILDPVVLPDSAVESSLLVPVPLGTRVQTHFVVLPELEMQESMADEEASGPALQIGAARAVDATASVAQTQSAMQWTPLPSGQQVAAINIQAMGAYGLRAGVLVEQLPDGALLRIYSQEHPAAIVERSGAQINALLAQNQSAGESGAPASTWWTPDVGAGDTTIEVVLPAGMPAEALRISIPRVSHIFYNLSLPTDVGAATVGAAAVDPAGATEADPLESCRMDVSCTSNYQTERNAVAQMVYTRESGQSYLCTGTLLNNPKADFVPYFLTANHCISTQSVASTLQTRWFYHASSCNSGVPSAQSARRSAGATLLHATATTDSALLRLNEMPPAGVDYAGWNATNLAPKGQAIYGLHHPGGDLLKYSVGAVADHARCQSTGSSTFSCSGGDANGGFYSVSWSQGRTEGGSSGSALFSDGRVIGTLYGGSSRCQAPRGLSYYGSFDKFFADGAAQWLGN